MSGDMQTYLLDTLIWTAILIAAVLLLRRPVAKYFGPNVAYALWLVPFIRLALPPVTLPAWLAPAEVPVSDTSAMMITVSSGPAPVAVSGAEHSTANLWSVLAGLDWPIIALTVWLVGAAIFLAVRFYFYFKMREQLLLNARPVGKVDAISLLETPDTNSPIAFGVIDKIIALPTGFMACTDQVERDLAIEHEVSHHRGHDLLINILVQPLFALHWFNPLGWYGWRALRHDQEAACDARVIAAQGSEQKAAYANVIASFAAGPDIALAAPMACPVIGEKSIIYRLRSLTMSDISPRRRIAGHVLLGAAVLALPLTASVSYAESLVSAPPAPPVAPASVTGVAPAVPTPPTPPLAALAQASAEAPEPPAAPSSKTEVYVIDTASEDMDGDTKVKVINRQRRITINGDEKMTAEEREELLAEIREELSSVDGDIREAMKEAEVAIIELRGKDGFDVSMECTESGEAGETTESDGKRVIRICQSKIMANALTGLKEARAALANNTELGAEMREQVLDALDEQIENWSEEG